MATARLGAGGIPADTATACGGAWCGWCGLGCRLDADDGGESETAIPMCGPGGTGRGGARGGGGSGTTAAAVACIDGGRAQAEGCTFPLG